MWINMLNILDFLELVFPVTGDRIANISKGYDRALRHCKYHSAVHGRLRR
jgi:hypothetical protein